MNAVFEAIRRDFVPGRMTIETSWNGAAFVGGLVNLCRPFRVIEVGAHDGTTSAHIARALHENMTGTFVAYEIEPCHCDQIRMKLSVVWPEGAWDVVEGDFFKTVRPDPVDFAFIDIDPKYEYIKAYQSINFADKATLVAHDATLNPVETAVLRDQMVEDGWKTITLPQERGFLVAVKP